MLCLCWKGFPCSPAQPEYAGIAPGGIVCMEDVGEEAKSKPPKSWLTSDRHVLTSFQAQAYFPRDPQGKHVCCGRHAKTAALAIKLLGCQNPKTSLEHRSTQLLVFLEAKPKVALEAWMPSKARRRARIGYMSALSLVQAGKEGTQHNFSVDFSADVEVFC